MVERFERYIIDKELFTKEDRLLVAVSGGMDSVVLCHVLHRLNYQFGIAHCNFQLRGADSDKDEIFVENLARQLGVVSYKKRFDTEGVAKTEKLSIQMVARQLRYDWFAALKDTEQYAYILTAHHASDALETALFNFAKGTGLRGLMGIKAKHAALVRPLIWAKRCDIEQFAETEKIEFRHDTSNDSDKYARNFIRHQVVPKFQHINSDFENTAIENLNRLAETQALFDFLIKIIKHGVVDTVDKQTFISRNGIAAYPSVLTVLFEILKDFGFNTTQTQQIWTSHLSPDAVGSRFYTPTHVLLIDRKYFIVEAHPTSPWTTAETFSISENQTHLALEQNQIRFHFSKHSPFAVTTHQHIAQFDFDSLHFPLQLRRWQHGDSFKPLGMGGKTQKLSDFFRLNKISDFDKQKVWLLETADKQICWVVGYRLDDRFKLREDTRICYQIECL
jgi:tRNA(Ile)-lysidine synthase